MKLKAVFAGLVLAGLSQPAFAGVQIAVQGTTTPVTACNITVAGAAFGTPVVTLSMTMPGQPNILLAANVSVGPDNKFKWTGPLPAKVVTPGWNVLAQAAGGGNAGIVAYNCTSH